MKQDLLFRTSHPQAQGTEITRTFSRGQFNGLSLFISQGIGKDDTMTVKIRGNDGTQYLIPRVPLHLLEQISDINNGFGRSGLTHTVATLINTLQANATITEQQATTASERFSKYLAMFAVDLGSVYLGDKEIEISISIAPVASATGTNNVEVYSYQTRTEPERYQKYDVSYDLEQPHKFVREAYIFTKEITASGNFRQFIDSVSGEPMDLSLEIDNEETVTNLSAEGIVMGSSIFGMLEDSAVTHIAKFYHETDALPAELHLKCLGQDAQKIAFLLIKEELPITVSKNTLDSVKRLQRKVEKLERDSPSVAKAYRHAGRIPKSEDAKQIVEAVELNNKLDKN